jgi:HTH-type transcriptional regulator/antitoxin HigA
MAINIRTRALPDTYFKLVTRFPLTRIRDDDNLAAAQEVIDQLLQQDRDAGAEAYLDVLTDLVEAYEQEHVMIPDASEAEVLRELLRANGLTQAKVAKAVGVAQSTLSAVLGGSRSLTKGQVVRLARYFNVPPMVFLSP